MVKLLLKSTRITGAVQVPLAEAEEPLGGVPNLALRRERAANGDGARLLGYSADWQAAVTTASTASLVMLLDVTLTEAEAALVGRAGAVVVLGTLQGQDLPGAQLVLPITTMAEEHGTLVNRDQRVQRYQQARTAPGMARPAWWIAAEAGRLAPSTAAEAFALVADAVPAIGGMTYGELGLTGMVTRAAVPAGV